ncbi:hypothetical protein BC939DRAFT_392046 [Gamsiella multidivaricata]|uniref:uncharacterized protein n=1 Tax=Gamsiella multidivaricata TaxID=101098 RepID=UPI002220370F|nr:uncharacterized protein BC939DRAFT_392046 [Gamsiella multidivaricata]KAI7831375.1 hypothetical protein BC939DRAFT_392046 [Gamsiella multidivaricata]
MYPPWELRPKDVEIHILNSSVCTSDTHMMDEERVKLVGGVVPGHKIVGKVIAAGPEALHQVGDRVGAGVFGGTCLQFEDCEAGYELLCTNEKFVYNSKHKSTCDAPVCGGFSDRIRLDSEFVYKIPDSIPLDEVVPLLCPGATSYAALRRAGAGPNSVVGIKGIGKMGHLAIQFAKAFGCREIVAFVDSPTLMDDALALGADYVVDLHNADQIKTAIHTIDLMLVNSIDRSTSWTDIFHLMVNRGLIVVLASTKDPITLPTMELVHRELKVEGLSQGGRRDVGKMLAFAASHKIRPWLVKFKLEDFNKAIELEKKCEARYSIVLEVSDQDPTAPHSEEKREAAAVAETGEEPSKVTETPPAETPSAEVKEAKASEAEATVA